MPVWDPDVYQRYKAYRDRPALDLMLQIPPRPGAARDLGPGLRDRRARGPAGRSAIRTPACTAWTPAPRCWRGAGRCGPTSTGCWATSRPSRPTVPPDLIFTNAALQWVDGHEALFPRLMGLLAPGGVLACQIPVVADDGWRRSLRETAAGRALGLAAGRYRARALRRRSAPYHDWLSPVEPGPRHLGDDLCPRPGRRGSDRRLDLGHQPAALSGSPGRSGRAGGHS
jgi:trans-aconitate 2-methyltransferase